MGRGSRRTERRRMISAKFNFSPEEMAAYEEFLRMLVQFDQEDMYEILSEVLKDAKSI